MKSIKYSPVSVSERSIDEHEELELELRCKRLQRYTIYLLAATTLLSFLCATLFLVVAKTAISDSRCTAKLSVYSPILSAVEYEERNFENDFYRSSPYRGPPSNRLERDWERLWNHDLIAIPEEDFKYLNKSTDQFYLKVDQGYAANIEVFHQLHCLNLVRQYTWKEYYREHGDLVEQPEDITRSPSEAELRDHVDHCIETLRITLMCHGDVTPFLIVTQNATDDYGTADFNPNHKCRRFDSIVEAFDNRFTRTRWINTDVLPTQYEQLVQDSL